MNQKLRLKNVEKGRCKIAAQMMRFPKAINSKKRSAVARRDSEEINDQQCGTGNSDDDRTDPHKTHPGERSYRTKSDSDLE